ncbi:MAG: RICIN domain-containing protein [Ruminococcus sp.]|nr:RICIN domain-containing protein [Ruminococcus sp.]
MKIKKLLSLAIAGTLTLSTGTYLNVQRQDAFAAANKARVSVHDPSVVKDKNGTYYVFGSHIDAAKTNDLQNWTRFTNGYARTNNVEFGNLSDNLKKAFAWAGEDLGDCVGGFAVWAPDVIWNPDYINKDGSKGAYLMYFCTSSTWNTSVIGYAASQKIEGPYTFVDTLIYSGFTSNDTWAKSSTKNVNRKYTSTNIDELMASGEVTYNNSWFDGTGYNYRAFPNAIDPTIYYDTDGKMYMVYGSWSGGIYTLQIDPKTGKCIHPKSGTTSDGRTIDSYFGTKLTGGYHKSGEGPFIEYNADTGYYYLWVTYGGLFSDGGYNMRVFRSKSPTGPFTDPAGRSGIMNSNSNLDNTGLKVMGNYKFSSLDKAYMACGHNSVLRDDDGKWYLFYHARFDDGEEFHEVRVHEMKFNEEGWPVVTPFEYGGDHFSDGGYEESDIVGDYEFINHGNATNGTIINYQNIKLNADHTISGAVTGKWEESSGSDAAVITIGNQKYSGYFVAAENEKGTKVMSFTAVGSNNQTIWGAKTSKFTGTARAALGDFTNNDAQLVAAPDTVKEPSAAVKLSGTELISGIPYFITNVNSGLSLDLPSGSLDAGTNIQQWDFNKSWAQQWRIVAVDNEWCRIVSMGDESKCIAVAQNSANDGLNVELQTYTGANNQLFKIVKSGTSYGIVSKCSNGSGALDVFEWSKENGGNINQYAYHEYACQLWNIAPVYPAVTPGSYVIKNLNSGMYITETDGNIVQGDTPTVWNIGKDSKGRYFIIDPRTGNEIFTEKNSAENGVNIVAAAIDIVDESPIVSFKFNCNKDGTYSILTGSSDYKACFDVYDISKENGANINQWEFWGGDGQKFILEPVVYMRPAILFGDVDADGKLKIADLVMLQNYLLRRKDTLNDIEAADLDKDSKIDGFDMILLRRKLLNK